MTNIGDGLGDGDGVGEADGDGVGEGLTPVEWELEEAEGDAVGEGDGDGVGETDGEGLGVGLCVGEGEGEGDGVDVEPRKAIMNASISTMKTMSRISANSLFFGTFLPVVNWFFSFINLYSILGDKFAGVYSGSSLQVCLDVLLY